MSAIGDYVHLTYEGYNDPDSAQKSPDAFPRNYTHLKMKESEAESAFKKQRDRMKKLIAGRGNAATAKIIQDRIRTFQGAMGDNSDKQRQFYNQFIRVLEKNLEVTFDELLEAAPAADSPVATPEVISIKKALRNIHDATRRKVKKGLAGVSFKNTLVPLQNALEKLGNDIQNGTINIENVDEVQRWWTSLQSEVISYTNSLNAISRIEGHPDIFIVTNNSAKSKAKEAEGITISITNSNGKSLNLIDFAQLVTYVITLLSPNLKKAKGTAAELVVAAASAVSAGKALKTADDAMKEAAAYHKGTQKGKIAYKPSGMAEDIMRELDNKHWKLDEKSGVITAKLATQNKEDVTFYVDEQPFAVSVKNYVYPLAKYKGFTGVSGSPFLFLAQELDAENDMFVNHWINSTIYHTSAAGQTDNSVLGSPKNIDEAHALMRYSLVVLGALGGVRKVFNDTFDKTSVVDYLVWNDSTGRTGEGMHVFAFKDVLEKVYDKIEENPNKWVSGYNEKFTTDEWSAGKMLESVKKSGKYITPMQIKRRISKLLAYMHSAKITTHFFLDDEIFPSLATKNI